MKKNFKKTICLTTLFLLILGSITVFATSPVELIVSPEKKYTAVT